MPHIARHDSWSAIPPRPTAHRRKRAISALLALSVCSSGELPPRLDRLAGATGRKPALITTHWISGLGSLFHNGQPVGAMAGSVGAAQTCSTANASAFGSDLLVPANEWVCGVRRWLSVAR